MANRDIKWVQRRNVLNEANDVWSILMEDPTFRREIEAEDAAWEDTLLDGLPDERW